MKIVCAVLIGICIGGCSNADPPFSADSYSIYATASGVGDETIIASVDSAIAPLGFRRLSAGTSYPGKSVPGIFAFYRAGDKVSALIVEASKQRCMALSVTNYDKLRPGLAKDVSAAMKQALADSFRQRVAFYADSKCEVVL